MTPLNQGFFSLPFKIDNVRFKNDDERKKIKNRDWGSVTAEQFLKVWLL